MRRWLGARTDWIVGGVGAVLLAAGAAFALMTMSPGSQPQAQVIQLTQVPCQFVESEDGIDRGFSSHQAADCETINAKSGAQRVAEAKPLVLKPGRYIFRVTNKDVPYELGFWLRGDGVINRARLPSVSGGGITTGKTQEYEVTLKPGEYVYSCPLNPTPDYKLIVKG